MTPDDFRTTLHRQRADLLALRAAVVDLTKLAGLGVADAMLSALQDRIDQSRTLSHTISRKISTEQAQSAREAEAALQRLHQYMARQLAPKETGDD